MTPKGTCLLAGREVSLHLLFDRLGVLVQVDFVHGHIGQRLCFPTALQGQFQLTKARVDHLEHRAVDTHP